MRVSPVTLLLAAVGLGAAVEGERVAFQSVGSSDWRSNTDRIGGNGGCKGGRMRCDNTDDKKSDYCDGERNLRNKNELFEPGRGIMVDCAIACAKKNGMDNSKWAGYFAHKESNSRCYCFTDEKCLAEPSNWLGSWDGYVLYRLRRTFALRPRASTCCLRLCFLRVSGSTQGRVKRFSFLAIHSR